MTFSFVSYIIYSNMKVTDLFKNALPVLVIGVLKLLNYQIVYLNIIICSLNDIVILIVSCINTTIYC